ncbi:MAG: pitrilysin family protein [Candidatus Krumholzibacteria bacterium]|nr:pitrilysin family protein [Candidatus Krumholzibacteria bacterium]
MKRTVPVILLAVFLAGALAAGAAAGKRPHPSALKYPPLEIETPEVVELSLAGGMEGFMIEDHEIPVVDIVLLFRAYFPEEGKYGLSEMAQWVIRNGGSASWPADRLNDELEFLPADIEVYGSDLATLVAVSCLKKDLDAVLGIAADLIRNPLFPEDKIAQKRGTMIEEIRRQNDQPNNVARREYMKLIYKGHPYGWEKTPATVEAVTRDDLVAFHARYFHPNNALIGVSGDVTKDEIVSKLDAAFEGWRPAEVEIPPVPPVPAEPAASWNYAFKDISQAYMMIGHLGINANNEDRCAVDIMNFILGGGSFTSWITTEVREKKGLAYSSGARYSADAFARGVFYAFAQTKAEEYSRAMQIIIDQIEKMRSEGPGEEELRKAVDSYLNSQVFDYDSKAGMVRRLVMLKYEGRPLDTPERDMETFARLTVDDVRRAAQKYLHPDRLTVLVVGDKEKFARPLGEFGPVNEIDLAVE